MDLNYPLLSDTDKKVASRYGILKGRWSSRSTIYVDKEGKIAYIENKVDLRNAGEQVVKTLTEMKVDKK